MSYSFTHDWFSHNLPIWKELIPLFKDRPVNALEIGSFEGYSAVWMLQNLLLHPKSHLTCVDPFTGNEEHSEEQISPIYKLFVRNVLFNHGEKVTLVKDFSYNALRNPSISSQLFDFIYIDGDHHVTSCLEDAILAFRLLRVGGIMIFDDYAWDQVSVEDENHPKRGVDAFVSVYKNKLNVAYSGYQLVIQKTAN